MGFEPHSVADSNRISRRRPRRGPAPSCAPHERGAPFRNPLVVASNPARERVWSGRWDLNPRQLAWEARTLPLSYARSLRYVAHLDKSYQPPEVQVLLEC